MKDLAILDKFSNEELEVLVQLIVDKGKLSEMLSTDDTYEKHYPNHKCYVHLIKKELRELGGNSFMNIIRGEGASYREMLMDVCKNTKTPFNEKSSLERIEHALLEKILVDTWDKMSDAEKKELLQGCQHNCDKGGLAAAAMIAMFRAGGFASYKLVLIIANGIAKAILGRGLPLIANAALAKYLAVFAGPIGWVLAGLWTLVDVSGPAYRVTIPAVVYIAALRQAHKSEEYKKDFSI